MTASKRICGGILTLLHGAVNMAVLAVFLLFFVVGIYVQWDSRQMLRQAEAVAYETYKPEDSAHLSFSELTDRNPDVFAWLTLRGTKVDYPVAQGNDNEYYVNTDVLGNFSLSGSIFLDYRNNRDFSDEVSILHGHHMAEDVMFGSFDRFADRDYFEAHRSGSLFYGDAAHALEIFAFLRADAYDLDIYNPHVEKSEKAAFIRRLLDNAEQRAAEDVDLTRPVVLMSTCESGETNGRMILAATIGDEVPPETAGVPLDKAQGRRLLLAGLLAAAVAAGILILRKKRTRNKEDNSMAKSERILAAEAAPEPQTLPRPSLGAEILMLLAKLAVIAAVFAALFSFVFGLHISTDESMSPTLKYRDMAIYYRLDKQADARELVVYTDASGATRIGRIVAVGGDSVDVTSEGLKINGYLQQEDYVSGETLAYQEGVSYPVTLAPGEYFVLGDYREQSADSRLFGPIPADHIKGRVITIIRHQNF